MRAVTIIGAALTLSVGLSHAATAQGHTLSGFVRDTLGQPLTRTPVRLDAGAIARATQTDDRGHFAFDSVAPGRHELSVLRLGYLRVDRSLNVPDRDSDVTITMQTLAGALDTFVVTSRRLGLYGNVVALHFPDPRAQFRDFVPLEHASIELIGSHPGNATTDTLGAFSFPEVKGGAYMLHITRNGYQSRNLAVTVPPDSGLGLAIVLDSGRSDDRRMASLMRDMRHRIAFRGLNSAFLSRADLHADAGENLENALRFSTAFNRTGLLLDPGTCVFVDGVPGIRPLSLIDASEVESVEVYGEGGDITRTLQWPRGMTCGGIGGRTQGSARVNTRVVAVWLRR